MRLFTAFKQHPRPQGLHLPVPSPLTWGQSCGQSKARARRFDSVDSCSPEAEVQGHPRFLQDKGPSHGRPSPPPPLTTFPTKTFKLCQGKPLPKYSIQLNSLTHHVITASSFQKNNLYLQYTLKLHMDLR